MHLQLILASLIWGLNIVVMKLTADQCPTLSSGNRACLAVLSGALCDREMAACPADRFVSTAAWPRDDRIIECELEFWLVFLWACSFWKGNQVALLNTLSPLDHVPGDMAGAGQLGKSGTLSVWFLYEHSL